MPSTILTLPPIQRPVTLVRAARHVVAHQPNPSRLLLRVLRGTRPGTASARRGAIAEREAELEDQRITAVPGYSVQAHVEALAALMLEDAGGDRQAKASGSAAFRCATKASSASRMPWSIAGAS